MIRTALIVLLLLRPALSLAHGVGGRSVDGFVTTAGGPLDPRPSPGPTGAFCEGVNYANDNHFDPAFMGGPLVGWNWVPASSVTIRRIEIFTGEVAATSRISLWSTDGGTPGQPLAPLGFSDPFATGVPKQWYGADLLTTVPVVAGTTYWIVWDSQGGEQVSASDDVADVQTTYWGSNLGTVEGGASWFGPFTFTDRRWKARMTCAGACESPALVGARGADVSACNDGIVVSWDAATFPPPGQGAYHVYKSDISFADAIARLPVALDVLGLSWVDTDTVAGGRYWYVVMAESLDFPNCGVGPLVGGSTAEVDVGPLDDAGDVTPPLGEVGGALRATGCTTSTVDFSWSMAAPAGPGERYAVFRSDDRADIAFVERTRTSSMSWTDPAVAPRPEPVHVWFYDVRIVDDCGNVSAD